MENRFKLKAWDKINQEMFEEIYLDEKCINCKVGNGWINRNYEDCIVMQSTGLNDKNGKEIFEGDVVKIDFGTEDGAFGLPNKLITDIFFYKGAFRYRWKDGSGSVLDFNSTSFVKNYEKNYSRC